MSPETQAWLDAHPEGLHVERPGADDWRMMVYDRAGAELRGVYAVDPPSATAEGYRCDPHGRFVVGEDGLLQRRQCDANGWILIREGVATVVGASLGCSEPGCVLPLGHPAGLMPSSVPHHPTGQQLVDGLQEATRISNARTFRRALKAASTEHPEAFLGSVDRGENAFVEIRDGNLRVLKDVCVVDRWGRVAQRMGADGSSFGWFSLEGCIGVTRSWRRLPFSRSPGPGVMAAFLVGYAATGHRVGR